MRYLFVHQNFPGQFLHVAHALAESQQHEVVALGDAARLKQRPPLHSRIRTLGYTPKEGGNTGTHHYLRDYEVHVRRGQSVARAALALTQGGFVPDMVIAHPGWGEALFLKDVFPNAQLLVQCEYYYHGIGGDMDFDPEFPTTLDQSLKARIRNSTQLVSLAAADAGVSPTTWQHGRYPQEFHSKIHVLHEGIDTTTVRPDPEAYIEVEGQRLTRHDEIVTYVARNLEPYRGFHSFIRSLPELLRLRPNARVLVVGGDEVSYGRRLPPGDSYRKRYCAEIDGRVDWSRVHFLGRLPYNQYLRVLQVSSCHVYLTYPFVLSWSMLEAMAAGCVVIGSDTAPVREAIRHGDNGLLTDFFDHQRLVEQIANVLDQPAEFAHIRANARSTIIEGFDLKSRCLPAWLALLQQ